LVTYIASRVCARRPAQIPKVAAQYSAAEPPVQFAEAVIFLFVFRGMPLNCRGLFRYGLDEYNPVTTPDLFVANLHQRCLGCLTVRIVFLAQPPRCSLVTPFPDQCPAINEVLLEMEMIIPGRLVPFWRDLHVETHLRVRPVPTWPD
jgi:hypothetical protein